MHVPGSNARHEDGFLERISDTAPETTRSEDARDNLAWNYGVRLFNEGYYWECHEVLEAVWMNAAPNSREKHLVQGIIHLANAQLKQRMKRPNAAQRLNLLALECFDRLNSGKVPRVMGLDIGEIIELARTDRAVSDKDYLITRYR